MWAACRIPALCSKRGWRSRRPKASCPSPGQANRTNAAAYCVHCSYEESFPVVCTGKNAEMNRRKRRCAHKSIRCRRPMPCRFRRRNRRDTGLDWVTFPAARPGLNRIALRSPLAAISQVIGITRLTCGQHDQGIAPVLFRERLQCFSHVVAASSTSLDS